MDIEETRKMISTGDIRAGETVLGHLLAVDNIRAGDVVDVVVNRYTGETRLQMHRPMLDMAAMTWSCMVCGDERPDAFISVAYRQIAGLEHMFADGARVNVRYCSDRGSCSATAGASGVWPPSRPVAEPVLSPDVPGCDLAAGKHATPHRNCLFT